MAIQEKFTDLPTVSSAQLTDIICAVQGYVSPSNLGLSVQESLQQIYNLFQQNIILYNAGNPNGAVAGTTFQLCWDTTNQILYVCTSSGTSTTAVWTKSVRLTAGSGITISQAGNDIEISMSASGMTWNVVTGTSASMAANQGFITNNAGLVTLSLPVTASVGTTLAVVGQGAGGWSIAQGGGQSIIVGSNTTTVGVGGSLSSTNAHDSINFICTVASTTWTAWGGPQGILTVV